jgi:alkylation response protein AidB-like acyl-CoA dehydrogenase
MHATLTGDELPVIEGFQALLDRQPMPEEELTRARVDDLCASLAEAGWLEAALPGGDLSQPFWVLAALAESAGRRDVPLPYPLPETWIALRALAGAGLDADADAEGGRVLTLAVDRLWRDDADPSSGAVPYAALADAIVVPLALAGGGCALHLAEPSSLPLERGPRLDDTMPLWSFPVAAAAGPGPSGELDASAASALRAQYLVLQCAEMVGCADRLFRRTIAYLEDREQFGHRLATFQALQHRAADAFTALETARSLTHYAAWCCEMRPELAEPYALMAKAHAGEHCWWIANEAIQLHGGIGFTWEAGLQYNTGRVALRALGGLDLRRCAARSGMAAIQAGQMLGMLE